MVIAMTCRSSIAPTRALTCHLIRLSITVVAMASGVWCQRGPSPSTLAELATAKKIAVDLQVTFTKATGDSDRAVMADTDTASITWAHEAERATAAIEAASSALGPHLKTLGYAEETRLLDEFSKHFVAYRKLDREVLQLAVENTNLKAQGLAFGPIRETADGFRESVSAIVQAVPARARCQAGELAAEATLAVRQIQVLQAPHIAEATDPKMERMETDMASLQAAARAALAKLEGAVTPKTRPAFESATSALSRFEALSGQLVALSRRNSNVRSLALVLGPKPALVAACDKSLSALVEALEKEGPSATR